MPPFDYTQYNRPQDQSGLMFSDPTQAYKSMLQARGYNPQHSLLGRYSLAAHAPQLQTLSYAMSKPGNTQENMIGNFGGLMNQWFDQNLMGRAGANNTPGQAYDLSDAGIQAGVQGLLGGPGSGVNDDVRQNWLRSVDDGGVLNRVQKLEDLSRGGMLPGFRESAAGLRETQYNDYMQEYLNRNRQPGDSEMPGFVDRLQGLTSPWKAQPLAGSPPATTPPGTTPPGTTPPGTTPPGSTPPGTTPPGTTPPGTTPPAPTPQQTAFLKVLQDAGLRTAKKGSLFEGGLYSGHPDAPARTSFSLGDYDYNAAADTNRKYTSKGDQKGWGSAINVAMRRFDVFKKQGMDDVSAWNAAVQWMMQHAGTGAKTGFSKKAPAKAS